MESYFPDNEQKFDPASIMLFEAVTRTIDLNKRKGKEFVSKELRERAIGHGIDPIEFAQDFWAWKKNQEGKENEEQNNQLLKI